MKQTLKSVLAGAVSLAFSAALVHAATVVHWNFDQGVAGQPFTNVTGGGEPSVPDQSGNGIFMWAWNNQFGPSYSSDTPTGTGLSSRHNGGQDGYVFEAALAQWKPTTWTIELSVKLDVNTGWQTMIGKDGRSIDNQPLSDLYLQKAGDNNRFRLAFLAANGSRYAVDSDFVVQPNTWYGLAFVSDGTTVTMYAGTQNSAFAPVGSVTMTGATPADNALGVNPQTWTFGRGWYNGGFVDGILGNMDDIRFSDVALSPSQFIAIPEPSTYALLLGGLALAGVLYRRRR
jgi:hypothetical protein